MLSTFIKAEHNLVKIEGVMNYLGCKTVDRINATAYFLATIPGV